MPGVEVVDAIPIEEEDTPRFESAAQFLDRAIQAGCQDPNVIYMLAMAYKHQGRTNEARTALRKITRPDAGILLQMGLISLQEQNLPQAEGELSRAWEMDKNSYEICYNLLLTQLTLGKVEACLSLLPRAIELAGGNPPAIAGAGKTAADEVRFLRILQSLLKNCVKNDNRADPCLDNLTAQDEQRLLRVVRSLGQLDTVLTSAQGSGRRSATQRAGSRGLCRSGAGQGQGIDRPLLLDRGGAVAAASDPRQERRPQRPGRPAQPARLLRRHDPGLRRRHPPLHRRPQARPATILACTKTSPSPTNSRASCRRPIRTGIATSICSTTSVPAPSDMPDYLDHLAYEEPEPPGHRATAKRRSGKLRSATSSAPPRLRPNDPDTLERLFHLYNQARGPRTPAVPWKSCGSCGPTTRR